MNVNPYINPLTGLPYAYPQTGTPGLPVPQAYGTAPAQEVRMEIAPVATVEDVDRLYVAAGQSKLAMAQDDSFVAVKTVDLAGRASVTVFDRRPPAPATPEFNPGEYVRRDEIKSLVEAALAAREGKEQ